MNGYDVSLKHSNSVWCVSLVISNVIHSYQIIEQPMMKVPYVLSTLNIYCYIITVCGVRIQRKCSRKLQALPPALPADR